MRIRCKNPETRRIFIRSCGMGEPVEFDDTGHAEVVKSVGEALIEHFSDSGVIVKAASKKPASTKKGRSK